MGVSQTLKVIAGRYRLEHLIGEGGMASVWRAKDLTLARPVAVKLLFARDERDHELLIARFLREARIAAAVQHRNVIHIVDFGTTDEGQPYMVMELLEGESLGDRLHRERKLPLDESIHIASMTLRGLSAVHDAGIIHRDLKPDNIYLKEEGGVVYPKILDFGISRSIEPSSGRRSALTTREGIIVGTPEYMSPEQARGLKEIDRRTDVYSMGVILYQMLSGKLPLQSENVGDLIIKIVTTMVTPLHEVNPDVPLALSEVVSRAMAKAPAQRWQNAGEMQDALHAAAESAAPSVRRSLSDSPPKTLTIPDGIPIARERLVSREFPLTTTSSQALPDGVESVLDELDTSSMKRTETADFAQAAAARDVPTNTADFTEQITGRTQRKWLWPVLALGAAGATAYFAMRGEPEQIVASSVAAHAGVTQHVVLQLRNLPADAQVTLDGSPVEGSKLELPKDSRARTLLVRAPGKLPWQAVYTASYDWTYDVALQDDPSASAAPAAAAVPGIAAAPPTAAPATTAPVSDAAHKPKAAPATKKRPASHGKSGALRDIDF